MLTSTDTAWLSTPATEAEPTCASMNASRTGHTSPEWARRPYADGDRGAEPYSNGTAGGFWVVKSSPFRLASITTPSAKTRSQGM
jgi:hypothetical protein